MWVISLLPCPPPFFPTPPPRLFLHTFPHFASSLNSARQELGGRGGGQLHHRAISIALDEPAYTLSSAHSVRLISSSYASNWKNQCTASVISNSFPSRVEHERWPATISPCPVASWTHLSPFNPNHVANIKSRC